MLAAGAPVPPQLAADAKAIIIEVQPDNDASMARLAGLRAANPKLMLVAAVRDAQIAVVRALLRSGINDVIELPLRAHDLPALLDEIGRAHVCTPVINAHLVCRPLLRTKNNS